MANAEQTSQPTLHPSEQGSAAGAVHFSRRRGRKVAPADRAERDRLALEALAGESEEQGAAKPSPTTVMHVERTEEGEVRPPPPPMTHEQKTGVVRPFVGAGLCAVNVAGFRMTGVQLIDADQFASYKASGTEALAEMLPEGLLRHMLTKTVSVGLSLATPWIEAVTGVRPPLPGMVRKPDPVQVSNEGAQA